MDPYLILEDVNVFVLAVVSVLHRLHLDGAFNEKEKRLAFHCLESVAVLLQRQIKEIYQGGRFTRIKPSELLSKQTKSTPIHNIFADRTYSSHRKKRRQRAEYRTAATSFGK